MKQIRKCIALLVENEISKIGAKNKILDIASDSDVGNSIAKDIANLVKKSYSDIGGFPDAETEAGVKSKFTHFNVADVDEDPEPDTGVLYKNMGGSKKIGAIASDGGARAKEILRKQLKSLFAKPNTWAELSGAPANIMINKYGFPTVDNEAQVRSLMPDREITWHGKHPDASVSYGEGWYTRVIDGRPFTKIIVGNAPKSGGVAKE
jgi:hypothetical protein